MGLTVKFVLPLIGALMLCGLVAASGGGDGNGEHGNGEHGHGEHEDVNSLPPQEKRRIIRELLRAQKDIKKALLKIHFHLDGEEIDEDDDDDEFAMKICWDKELGHYRKDIEKKMAALSKGLKHANKMLDEIEHYGSAGHGDQYGGSGYEDNRPENFSRPPPTSLHQPDQNWNAYGENGDESEDEYYNRRLNTGGYRRYGRQMHSEEKPVLVEQEVNNAEAIESNVAEAIEQLAADTE